MEEEKILTTVTKSPMEGLQGLQWGSNAFLHFFHRIRVHQAPPSSHPSKHTWPTLNTFPVWESPFVHQVNRLWLMPWTFSSELKAQIFVRCRRQHKEECLLDLTSTWKILGDHRPSKKLWSGWRIPYSSTWACIYSHY